MTTRQSVSATSRKELETSNELRWLTAAFLIKTRFLSHVCGLDDKSNALVRFKSPLLLHDRCVHENCLLPKNAEQDDLDAHFERIITRYGPNYNFVEWCNVIPDRRDRTYVKFTI